MLEDFFSTKLAILCINIDGRGFIPLPALWPQYVYHQIGVSCKLVQPAYIVKCPPKRQINVVHIGSVVLVTRSWAWVIII